MKHAMPMLSAITAIVVAMLFTHTANAGDMSVQEIESEYQYIRAKRIGGYYGASNSKSAQVIKGYEVSIANYLAYRIEAKKCSDLQKRIPSLDTGYYLFSPEPSQKRRSVWLRNRLQKPVKPIVKRCASVASMVAAISPVL